MSITQKEILQLKPGQRMTNKGCGNGLNINVESQSKGGRKTFIGIFQRKVVGKRASQIPCRVGKFGALPGEFSLKEAREKWAEIKDWAIRENKDPKDFYKLSQIKEGGELSNKTLKDAIESFLDERKGEIKRTTLRDYRNKFYNQILTSIDGDLPLNELGWSTGGRGRVKQLIRNIESRKKYDLAHRCRQLLSQCFDFAIDEAWMPRGENPASKSKRYRTKHRPQHHPTIHWDKVPALLQAINLNRCNGHIQTVLSVKLLLMTFLRVGALTRLEWGWIDEENQILVIPGQTPGLKRKKGSDTEFTPHHVPLTKEMNQVLNAARELNGQGRYVFAPLRESLFPHLDPSTPNNYLKNLGYRDVLRAHGWRSVALTVGQDVMKVSHEVIQRQMGHLPHKEGVRGNYDNSLLLEERRDFLKGWCSLLVEQGLRV